MVPRNWWNVENVDEAKRWSSATLFLKDVYNILLKGITPTDNFRGALFTVEFTAADTDVQIRHGLQFVPQNYFVVGCSAAMNIYDGSESATNTYFYLRSSAIGTARIFLF